MQIQRAESDRTGIQTMQNLLRNLPHDLSEEVTQTLVAADSVRIERIISHGQSSPEGFWYDQPEHEWVVVLTGSARLRFEDQTEPVVMQAGDVIQIPAHRRHRVEKTAADEPTIWLAVHYRS